MESSANQQISHQNTSTTMWTQPQTEEQKRYYSKHSPKRRVYGWIMTLLQTAHGFLAFAAWTSIYFWVFQGVPELLFLAPILSISTLFALHILFRTTWDTFWYDRLDDDPNTDSSVWMPIAIITLLLFAEVNGARQYLAGQVKPIERRDTKGIDNTFSSEYAALEKAYDRDKAEINSIYRDRERATAAPLDRQIRNLKAKEQPTGAVTAQRDKAVNAIRAEKAAALQALFEQFSKSKGTLGSRKEGMLTEVDNHNATETARYTNELGSVDTYAWVLSVALLSLIAGLGYARVRINVKSGILPLRNYTVLDAHGSVVERFATAFGDAFNRRSLQLAVWFHKLLSPKKAITSFDGTIVQKAGTYNTPAGFFPSPPPAAPPTPDDEATIRAKVFTKLSQEAQNGGIQITSELLESELAKAKTMNGSYLTSPLGKSEPSAAPTANVEGPYPAEDDEDKYLVLWASRVHKQVTAYDAAIRTGNPEVAEEVMKYINDPSGPIRKEAERLGIQFGVEAEDDEIVVWNKSNPAHKVPLSMLSKEALKAANAATVAPPIENRFKSNLNQFQDEVQPYYENGKVIGVKYKKDDGTWSVIGSAATASRLRISERYASVDNPSPKVLAGLAKWQYAMSLIKESVPARIESLETITA